MQPSVFNMWPSSDSITVKTTMDAHTRLSECIEAYNDEYRELSKNIEWKNACAAMFKSIDQFCKEEVKETWDGVMNPFEKDKKESEGPGDEVAKMLKGLKSIYDKPSDTYTGTPEKQESFEWAKPKIEWIIVKLQWFKTAPEPEEWEAIKKELFEALWYITK